MYDPKGNGKERAVELVQFLETEPPAHLRGIVHRYLELKTTAPLEEDYRFHALPDACTYLVFDQLNPQITGASKLRVTSEEFNLGRRFHFINVRLLPGVWQDRTEPVAYGQLTAPCTSRLPFLEVNKQLHTEGFTNGQGRLTAFVETLMAQGYIAPNPVSAKIFQHLDDIHTVADIAKLCDLSTRQLQRVLKQSTGFAPHDFLKVLRLQQSLNGSDTWGYADQSHFIHSFRKATGYTPGKYAKKYDV